jgi:hypothetical protein
MSILEHISARAVFQCTTPEDFFALQLAARIGDLGNVQVYATAAARLSIDHLLAVLRRVVPQIKAESELAGRLRQQLLIDHST